MVFTQREQIEEESFGLLFRSFPVWCLQLSEYNLQSEALLRPHQVQTPNCALPLPMQNHCDRFLFGNLLRSWSDSCKLLGATTCVNVLLLSATSYDLLLREIGLFGAGSDQPSHSTVKRWLISARIKILSFFIHPHLLHIRKIACCWQSSNGCR